MWASEPVRIETERLVLRGHASEDFEPLAEMWADPEVVKFIGAGVSNRQGSWMRLLRYRGLWPVLGYGYWAVEEKSSGRFMGELGFADFHREIEPSIVGIPEAGWVFAAWAHGQGFATEALRAGLAWLDQDHRRSVCLVAPENGRSIRVAEKCGFVLAQSMRFKDEEPLLMARKRGGNYDDQLRAGI